jgi:hypothetical protein
MSRLLVYATVSVSVFAFVVLSLSSRTYAISAIPSNSTNGNAIIQELKEIRCGNIIETFDENKIEYTGNYRNIISKIQLLITDFDSSGYNTKKLKADLETLQNMTLDFSSKYTIFINTLKDAKAAGCGISEGVFAGKLEQAKIDLKIAKEQAGAILEFVNTTIRKDIEDINGISESFITE